MSLLDEYMTGIKPKIQSVVHETLATTIKDGLCDAIEKSAWERVYQAYTPSEKYMAERRYMLGDRKNLLISVDEDSIRIQNIETLRDDPSQGEAVVVEEGMKSFGQPFPRPFMEPALQDYIGFAEADLYNALSAAGFDVSFTYDAQTARDDELPF